MFFVLLAITERHAEVSQWHCWKMLQEICHFLRLHQSFFYTISQLEEAHEAYRRYLVHRFEVVRELQGEVEGAGKGAITNEVLLCNHFSLDIST